jgi:hypothetical protein
MNDDSLKQQIMETIAGGKVVMRPRWHFLILSALLATGSLILLLSLVYTTSLLMFFLHESGAWFTPSFGVRGWFAFLGSLPWMIVLLLGVFVLLLEVLVRRYSFVYKKPLLISTLVILSIVLFGGFAVAKTSFHRQMTVFARGGVLPAPLQDLYRPPFRLHPDDVHRGVIIRVGTSSIYVRGRDGAVSTVIIHTRTRLPYGADFEPGDSVMIIGDTVATDTIRAFGLREVEMSQSDTP